MEEEGQAVTMKSSLLAKEILDRTSLSPFTSNLALSIFVIYCAAFAAGTSIGYSSPTRSGIIHDIGLSSSQYSVFVTTPLVGSICGSAWSGKFADVIGRRRAIGLSSLLSVMGWLSVAFSKDALWLDVGRFLVGCGGGLSYFGLTLYISEVTPQNIRGTIMSSSTVVIACGKALSFVVGPLIHWRTLALIGITPFIFQLLLLLFCTESPRWLMKSGRVQESEIALRRLRGAKADISQETLEIKEFTEYCSRTSEDGFLSLFQRKYARCLTIGIGMMVFTQLSGIAAITCYTSSIIHFAGFPSTIGSMTVGIVEILSALLALSAIDKLGRRPLLLISSAGCCLGTGLIALSFLLQSLHLGEKVTTSLALVGLLVYFGSFCSGLEGIPAIIVSEIFPVNIKGVGGSIVNVTAVICGCIVAYSYNSMFEWSSAGIFMIYAVVVGIGILFIWKMVPETKGKSLEEIQANIIHEQ